MDVNTVKKSNSKAKRRLLTIVISIVLVILVLFIASLVINQIGEKDEIITERVIDYNFYPANFEENIFEDPEYLDLIFGGFIKFTNQLNITTYVDKDNAFIQGQEVEFLVNMIYDIVNGNSEAYNARFSQGYYKNHLSKSEFTMQKVYDATIAYYSDEYVSDDSGNYTKYVYTLEYKIFENNGTFRKDIGAGSKKQYITLTNKTGELLIESINTVN